MIDEDVIKKKITYKNKKYGILFPLEITREIEKEFKRIYILYK